MALLKTKWIEDNAVTTTKFRGNNNEYLKWRNNADDANVNVVKVNASDDIEFASDIYVGSNKVQTAADKGVANGIASLDGTGRIPSSQLTIEAFEYKGTWAASTNTPTLADGTGNTGDVYHVSDDGTVDFGAGNISFNTGDKVVYNGSVWEKWDLTDGVTSVNGATGIVVLDSSDLNHTQDNTAHWTVADESSIAAHLDELGSRVFDLESSGAVAFKMDQFVLTGTDISNGFVTTTETPILDSQRVFVQGSIEQIDGIDYDVTGSTIGFLGDLATLLVAGDRLVVAYAYVP